MSRTLPRFALLFLAFWVAGGQWMALQSLAWVGMVRDYSQGSTLSKALGKTFDGEHPCRLCRFIQKERASAEGLSKTTVVPSPKTDLFAVSFAVLAVFFLFFGKPLHVSSRQPNGARVPLTPPPKPAFL